jgi:glucosamine 6-phosphate synthetase-like amidotransferase/phosphosugar isomerase protein
MSSYLTFYLVPKKTKKKYSNGEEIEIELSTEPLSFIYYCRSSDIYQAYNDNLHPAYCDSEDKYTELTYQDAMSVVKEYEKDVKKTRKRLELDYKILQKSGYSEEMWEEIHSFEEYLEKQEQVLKDLNYIAEIVYDITEGVSDFEKILINID